MVDTRKSEQEQGKRVRVPFGGMRLKMQLSDEDLKSFEARKMVTRWFNDHPGRIDRALGAGYSYVSPERVPSLGQGALHGDGKDPESNKRVSIVAGKGADAFRAYLMEIPKQYYDEDQALKEERNKLTDQGLGLGGKIDDPDLENAYRPK